MGDARPDHRVFRVELWLLRARYRHIRVGRSLVHSGRRFTSSAPENIEKRTRLHSRVARRHSLESEKISANLQSAPLDPLPGVDGAPLRIPLGLVLPANCRSDVHDRSTELQPVESRLFVVTATPRPITRRLRFWRYRRLHSEEQLHASDHDQKVVLCFL